MSTPLINGVNYSWANIKLVLFGVPVVGITKINYKISQVKDNNYGMGPEPVSRGYGRKSYEGSIELYMDEWQRIIAASPLRDPLSILPFDIQVIYASDRIPTPIVHKLRSVEFMENPLDGNEGDSKLMVTIPLIIGAIEK